MTKNHLIISGTGRAGTTFLVQLLTELGLDTGFRSSQERISENSHAGMEIDLRHPDAPYIVKSPWICDYLEDLLASGEVKIDRAILPLRDLFSAAESRRFVSQNAPNGVALDSIPGGLWHTQDPYEQEKVLSMQLYKLIFALVKFEVPTTFILFPKFLYQPDYLYSKLWFLFNNFSYNDFLNHFNNTCHLELTHKFEQGKD